MNFYKRHLGDYAKDTGHLSVLEHGVYTLLLDRYYSTERPIPDAEACRIARARSLVEREAVAAVLSEFFKRDGDCWRHSYADRVIEAHQHQAQVNREQGRKGGRPSLKNYDETDNQKITESVSSDNRIGFDSDSKPITEKNPSHKPIAISQKPREKQKQRASAPDVGAADLVDRGVLEAVAVDFLQLRKAKRSPLTATALAGIEREAVAAGYSVHDAIRTCVERGWAGFKAEWVAERRNGAPMGRQAALEARNAAAVDEWLRQSAGTDEVMNASH